MYSCCSCSNAGPVFLSLKRATVLKLVVISLAAATSSSSSLSSSSSSPSKANFSDATCAAPGGDLVNKNTNNDTKSGTSRVSRSSGRIIPRGMAWRSHGTDNDSLVNALVRNRVLKTRKVIDAMRRVDRGNYCVPFSGQSAYEDHPLPIGSNATISAPHMHAACLELVHDRVTENARVLDVGSGSGYHT